MQSEDTFSGGSMKNTCASRAARRGAALLLAVFFLAGAQGCSFISKIIGDDPPPPSEIVLDAVPSYGVISNITPAVMLEREVREGDIAITVDLEDGRVVTVVQPEDETYVVGDRVRIIRSGKIFSRVQLL